MSLTARQPILPTVPPAVPAPAKVTPAAALDAYTVHPDHVKVADFGRGISDHVVSVDFEK